MGEVDTREEAYELLKNESFNKGYIQEFLDEEFGAEEHENDRQRSIPTNDTKRVNEIANDFLSTVVCYLETMDDLQKENAVLKAKIKGITRNAASSEEGEWAAHLLEWQDAVAKLGIGENAFTNWLKKHHYIKRINADGGTENPEPIEKAAHERLLVLIPITEDVGNTYDVVGYRLMVTPEGYERFKKELWEEGLIEPSR